MREIFIDHFRPEHYPVVQLLGYSALARISMDKNGNVQGPDWKVFQAILNHMDLRWNLSLVEYTPDLLQLEWFSKELHRGNLHILIDRNIWPDQHLIPYVLPEMIGVCLVIPKAKKYQILHHLLKPLQPTSWILLLLALAVGSLLATRFFKNDLISAIIFGVDLDASNVSQIERMVLFSSVFVFFVLSEAYQAKLLAFMSSFRYPPDPKNVEEFLQTDIMLQLGEAAASVVSIRTAFKGRIQNWTDYEFSFDGGQEYGVMLQCPFAWDYMLRWSRIHYKHYGYNIRPGVHIVREKIISLGAAYTFSDKFYLYPRFRSYLERLFESGLVGYWEIENDRQRQLKQKFEFVENEIISFSDLIMVWIILGIGYGLALALFILELIVFKAKQYMAHYQFRRAQ
ncbi:uncharacterized protein LOC128724026 [Anopheles nili]|uniref:uncharacterized protein LOC128724026 n=1 Tax=Anopheles nili TaxID=185578 RepID=UPI00237A0BFB|nr:uncharacterized protein LOC128724026 [Anopheles nili]